MPITALVRNLGKMTAIGLVKPFSEAASLVVRKLGDPALLKRARIHPLAVLIAQKVYAQGRGEKGSLSWKPESKIVDALDAAFYASFQNVKPCGKPVLRRRSISCSTKPRGLVTTAADEKGRPTVYHCLAEADLPWLAPAGRIDKASEGLLLLTNDTKWAARILAPETRLEKTYHVQVDCLADAALLQRTVTGIAANDGDILAAKSVRLIRQGTRNSWLEVVLDEGKNRHIRRLLEALGVKVLRLVRVAIGPLGLGNLAKGRYRHLTDEERRALAATIPS